MRQHNGMRPQDVVVLMKIVALGSANFTFKDIAEQLYISASEVTQSLKRSQIAGLVDVSKTKIKRLGLLQFLQFGLQYVFPLQPGTLLNGIATAHSHPFMQQYFKTEIPYVWADVNGTERGLNIEPFYPKQPQAVKSDEKLYKLLALLDVIRIGKTREIEIANTELKKIILNEP